MFTGIITGFGSVAAAEADGDGLKLTIEAPYADVVPGESIAVNGACLTVVDTGPGTFSVEVVVTTRQRTTLSDLGVGSVVNLERALAVGDRMGGHFVQGHVDGVGELVRVARTADALLLDFRVPADIWAVTVPQGSITFDGVSLTVNALPESDVVQVSIIPYTAEQTTLGSLKIGDRVHVESDMIGKMVQRLLEVGSDSAPRPS
ncbi:MAG: riboflavin synthase [Gemmatimonadetes bacterium]|nr:riboflavin synthase [Gemmatimonadota bacterium]